MKIALVCEFPFIYPQKGVELRLHQTATLLSEIGTVWPIIVTRFDTPSARLRDLQEKFGEVTYVRPTEKPSTFGKLRRLLSLKNIADRGYHLSASTQAALLTKIKACDVVWVHSLKAADGLGIYRWSNSILDFDDLNSKKHLQTAILAQGFKDKIHGRWLAFCWSRWEVDALHRFKQVVVCSEEDRQILSNQNQIEVMPNIFDQETTTKNPRNPSGDRIGFVGTLEYSANLDAVLWFVEAVLPLLVLLRPSIQFRVVGKIPATMATINNSNVELLGYVDNLADEMATWSTSVAPLRIGGGTRLKILESFSRQCPVVSTSLGCYGLNVRDRVELLIRDSAEEFAAACDEVCRTPTLAAQLGAAAFLVWQEKYTLAAARPVVRRLVENCIKQSSA